MTIGERVKIARKQIGMSQEELGKRLDIGKSSISEWEANKRSIPIDTIELIASILDSSVPFLMGWDVSVPESNFARSELSVDATTFAHNFDKLDDHGKQIVSAVMDLELKRVNDASYAAEVERFNSIADEEDFIESNAL